MLLIFAHPINGRFGRGVVAIIFGVTGAVAIIFCVPGAVAFFLGAFLASGAKWNEVRVLPFLSVLAFDLFIFRTNFKFAM